jgi:hypothetical protein
MMWWESKDTRGAAELYMAGLAKVIGNKYGVQGALGTWWGNELTRSGIENTTRTLPKCYICDEAMFESPAIHANRVHLRDVTVEQIDAFAALVRMRGFIEAAALFFGTDQQKGHDDNEG